MAVDRTPLVNGAAYSYVDININIEGVLLSGVANIKYKEIAEKVNNYGLGRRPVSRGAGKIEVEASITIDRAEFNALVNAAPGKSLINIPPFDMTIAYLPNSNVPVVDILKNVEFMDQGSGGALDDSSILVELALLPSHIEFNANL